ncbi:MAG TPA: N-methyl-L-tryptophan oxidase [Chitinophagaceae bacterium]|nr:N-methyl-L-tryptophan oxidase [Chitinophagaceae bacterium]
MKKQTIFDVIVLGVGSMGSSTCYYLAKQGIKVLGLELFDIPHELGSHGGQSRLIRKAYFEHSDYVPLLERAYENWKDLEKITNRQIYFQTGLLYCAKPDHSMMKGIHESADRYKIKIDALTSDDLKTKYPQLNVPDDYEKLFEPEAGFLSPEKAIILYAEQASIHGAVIKTKVKVLEWKQSNGTIEVKTSDGNFSAKKLVITAGPWAGKLIPGLSAELTVTRQILGWIIPKDTACFEPGKFPCWLIADDKMPGSYYGFPALPSEKFIGPDGFKLAHHHQGSVTDPDMVDRVATKADEDNLMYALNKFFPGTNESIHVMKTCLYTNTPDENFILDFLPGYDKNVVVATGFSGHGFKFASVVGEIMSELAVNGSTSLPINFLNARRFMK